MHGYQLIQEIARRSDGVWRPSAGSVYPALALLEDEGLVRPQVAPDDEGGKKVFVLTDAGRAYVTEHADELADPWDAVTGGVSDSMAELMGLIREVHGAAVQVLRSGDAAPRGAGTDRPGPDQALALPGAGRRGPGRPGHARTAEVSAARRPGPPRRRRRTPPSR